MPEQLGKNIKAAREAAGLTQEELGAKLGVTGVTIMRYEKGQREPKIDVLAKIAAVLDVTRGQLLGWSREPDPLDDAVLEVYPSFNPDNGTISDQFPQIEKEIKKDPKPEDRPEVTEDDIKFALFGGAGEITDEMYDEVKEFVKFVKMKHGQEG